MPKELENEKVYFQSIVGNFDEEINATFYSSRANSIVADKESQFHYFVFERGMERRNANLTYKFSS